MVLVSRNLAPPLLPVFRSRLVGELLALLTADPARQWTLEELAKRTGSPYQTVTAEVRRLADAGLLVEEAIGRSKLVRIDETNLNFPALAELTSRSFGPPLILAEEFADLANIHQVFIYGSWAARHAGQPGPLPNDVDVLIVGHADRDEVYEAVRHASERLGIEVNTTIRTRRQWASADDGFSRELKGSPLVPVIGPPGSANSDRS
jgi:hypothetical protein